MYNSRVLRLSDTYYLAKESARETEICKQQSDHLAGITLIAPNYLMNGPILTILSISNLCSFRNLSVYMTDRLTNKRTWLDRLI